jgi:hypothetical protein
MELSNQDYNEPKLTQVAVQLDESTVNRLRIMQREDGISPGIRLRNVIKHLVANDRITTYRGN